MEGKISDLESDKTGQVVLASTSWGYMPGLSVHQLRIKYILKKGVGEAVKSLSSVVIPMSTRTASLRRSSSGKLSSLNHLHSLTDHKLQGRQFIFLERFD